MEDEDDAQSSPPSSPSSGSPRRPVHARARPPVGVPAVTVAAAPPQQTLALALPIQQHTRVAGGSSGGGNAERGGGGGGSSGGGGREDCWSEGATSVLIEAWGERYLELSRGNLRQQHWQEVADIVSARDDYTKPPKTDVQCKNRIDTLKKKYKLEKARAASGAGPSKWAFFQRLDVLVGPNPHQNSSKTTPPPSSLPPPKAAKAAANHHKLPSNLPVAIPVGPRSFHHFQKKNHHHHHNNAQLPNPRSGTISSKTNAAAAVAAAAAAAAAAPPSPDSSEGSPPKAVNGKKRKSGKEAPPRVMPIQRTRDGGEGLRELTRAILNFGEVYERVESSKLQQMVEMEKQRMGFAKELELQRMQFFMKTQMELTQLKRHGRAAHAAANNNSNSDHTD